MKDFGIVLFTSTSYNGEGETFSISIWISTSCGDSEYTSERLDSSLRELSVSMDSFKTSMRVPEAVYGMAVSSVGSSSFIEETLSPKSVDSMDSRCTSISHARCFLLEFLRINSPSINCFLIVPSGFNTEVSVSLSVA